MGDLRLIVIVMHFLASRKHSRTCTQQNLQNLLESERERIAEVRHETLPFSQQNVVSSEDSDVPQEIFLGHLLWIDMEKSAFTYTPMIDYATAALGEIAMEKFGFSSQHKTAPTTTFNGPQFYNVYKEAEFLRIDANVETLLARGFELRHKLKTVSPGQSVVVEGMNLERNTPLLVKNTAKNIIVEDFEFTYNRLVSLAAAYAYENRHRFPNITASEAKALGLVWDHNNADKCKLYLSAVSGTEHLIDQFSFWPLLCGLRKHQLNKLPVELVVKMGNIKNNDGETMAKVLKNNLVTAKRIWLMFEGTSLRDFQSLIDNTPQLKKLFQG